VVAGGRLWVLPVISSPLATPPLRSWDPALFGRLVSFPLPPSRPVRKKPQTLKTVRLSKGAGGGCVGLGGFWLGGAGWRGVPGWAPGLPGGCGRSARRPVGGYAGRWGRAHQTPPPHSPFPLYPLLLHLSPPFTKHPITNLNPYYSPFPPPTHPPSHLFPLPLISLPSPHPPYHRSPPPKPPPPLSLSPALPTPANTHVLHIWWGGVGGGVGGDSS